MTDEELAEWIDKQVNEDREDWNLNFNLGNAIKYIARAEHKGNKKEDLEKAVWYLEREISKAIYEEDK
ncbi:DUF3310 domain-containing protein [Clostridium sporogenes]|nr:DUF3310 domain-containing protein [Clostridium sporogenes]NFL80321.1 DUF3310 domain-containing protein [Clostridium sporogenes]NFU40431.1 DUF3310 domain-containing protein [Clostridium sporogenes]NFU80093.1 DUF3310 domain-containing protein [Clostridium sporogenes]